MPATKRPACATDKTQAKALKKAEDDALSNAGSDGSETLSLTTKKPKKKAKEGLSSEDLKKLATLSLKEKVKMIAQKFEDEDEQVEALGKVVTSGERGGAWQKYKAVLNSSEKEKEEYENSSKKEKGQRLLNWMMRNSSSYVTFSHQKQSKESYTKEEEWLSQQEADAKWTEWGLNAHMASGRITAREDPVTKGVWEYRDNYKFKKQHKVSNDLNWSKNQEENMLEDGQEEDWEQVLGQDLGKFLQDMSVSGQALALKSKGKGKEGKGGKGKTKGKEQQLALTDATEADKLEEAKSKARKMKNMMQSTHDKLEEALQKVEKSKWAAPSQLEEAKSCMETLMQGVKLLKDYVSKETTVEKIKEDHVKEAKECMKELKHIATKTASKASNSSK